MRQPLAIRGRLLSLATAASLLAVLALPNVAAARVPAPAARPEAITQTGSLTVAEVTPDRLATSIAVPRPPEESEEPPETASRPGGLPDLRGSSPLVADGGAAAKGATPAPSIKSDTGLWGTNDPQVAASEHYVVVTSYSWIEVYDKSGHPLGPKHNQTFANPFSTYTLYQPAWKPGAHNIQSQLNLPPNLACDPNGDITSSNRTSTKYCLDDFYDTRVVYDTSRKRFWFLSLARNTAARTLANGDPVTDPAVLMGRRSYMLGAVSKTEDPRDGFYVFWWAAAVDEGACNLPIDFPCPGSYYHPGDAGDYPWLAVNSGYLVTNVNVSNVLSKSSRYDAVSLLDAGQLASGTCNGCRTTLFDIPDYDGDIITGGLKPVQELTTVGFPLLALSEKDSIQLYAVVHRSSGLAVLRSAAFLGRDFNGVVDADLPGTSDTMHLTNIGNLVTGAVFRKPYLYVSTMDCASFGQSHCSDGIRLIRIDAHVISDYDELPTSNASGFYDVTFGLRAGDDPADAVVDYGLPDLTVTKNGDVVTAYVRAGNQVYPEVRYTILYHNEGTAVRGSMVVKKGNFSETGNLDTGGIALDPSDKASVWMAHGRGDSSVSTFRIVLGKVKP